MGFDSDFQKPIVGTITTTQNVDISSPNQTVSIIQLTGSWSGTLVVEGSNDNSNFVAIPAIENSSNLTISGITTNGIYVAQTNGYQFIRLRFSVWSSGSATYNIYGSDAASLVSAISLLRGGSDGSIIGNVGDALKITSPADTVVSGTITALNGTVQMAIGGHKSEAIVLSGTWIATCVVEYSSDNGVTWVLGATHANVGYSTNLGINTVLLYNTISANGTYYNSSSGGHTHIRIRASAFTSGTINVSFLGVEGANSTLFGQMNISQTSVVSANNSTTSNLTSGSTWTGTSERTLAFNAIQVTVYCDQPVTVQLQQSMDNTNWDIIDSYNLEASEADSRTFQATSSYFIVLVTNNGVITTSTLRVQSVLCPIAEVLPRSLTEDGDLSVDLHAQAYSEELPNPSRYPADRGSPVTDEDGRLETHATVTSDLGTFRDDFSGTSLLNTLTGTVYFTNGSDQIRGIGTLFTSEIKIGQFIRKSSDTPGETTYYRIDSIESDILITIEKAYTGSTQGTTAVTSNWLNYGNTTLGVANSIITISSGTAAGFYRIERDIKFPSVHLTFKAAISQRIANQTIRMGSVGDSDADNPVTQACIVFDGTDNTKVKLRTASSSAAIDQNETTVTLPAGLDTSQYLFYTLDITKDEVVLSVNNKILAITSEHIPDPYDDLELAIDITNSTTVTNTDVMLDFFYATRLSRIEIKHTFTGQPLEMQMYGISTTTGLPVPLNLDSNGNLIVTALTGFGANFTFGDQTNGSSGTYVLERTTYTEQTTNSQRSFASGSANDTSAGTGARAVTIIYYDQTGAGPFSETVTLNGTARVNTVGTNICFIENMIISSVGSGGSNVGIITLYTTPTSGGSAIGTIAVGDNRTFWSHHYVPSGKVCNITGQLGGTSGTTQNNGGQFFLKAKTIGVSTSPEYQVSDLITCIGAQNSILRNYNSPIVIAGPARITQYVTKLAGTTYMLNGSFDFFQP